nr:hypothetical protein CFP56_01003 [Quercus suber]
MTPHRLATKQLLGTEHFTFRITQHFVQRYLNLDLSPSKVGSRQSRYIAVYIMSFEGKSSVVKTAMKACAKAAGAYLPHEVVLILSTYIIQGHPYSESHFQTSSTLYITLAPAAVAAISPLRATVRRSSQHAKSLKSIQKMSQTKRASSTCRRAALNGTGAIRRVRSGIVLDLHGAFGSIAAKTRTACHAFSRAAEFVMSFSLVCPRLRLSAVLLRHIRLCYAKSFPNSCLISRSRIRFSSEIRSFRRLWEFLVHWRRHISSDLDQNRLHCELTLPNTDARKLGDVNLFIHAGLARAVSSQCHRQSLFCCPYLSVARINTWQVDFTEECHLGRSIRIVSTTVDFQSVDTVFMNTLSARPVG